MAHNETFEEIWDNIVKDRVLLQKKEELFMLYNEIMAMPKRDYCLELGTHHAGTTVFFSKLFKHVVTIDNKQHTNFELLMNDYPNIECLLMDLNAKKTVEILKNREIYYDFVFIDAWHSYDAVKHDFETFSPLAKPNGLVALHDILKTSKAINNCCDVDLYWQELKPLYWHKEFCYTGQRNYKHPHVGFINETHPKDWGGIGIIKWEGLYE